MKEYLEIVNEVLEHGVYKEDRTGTGTYSTFGVYKKFDLTKGFPLLTTKKVHFKSIAYELLWFLRGGKNIDYLKENGVSIWDEWAKENGAVGPIYGVQWRNWGEEYDQIKSVIEEIKKNPDSRRLLVSAWNVSDIPDMVLPPCHYSFQFYVSPLKEGEEKRRLSCIFNMRSTDVLLGLPYNIASYALLTHMIAQVTGLDVGELIYSGGDVHIYSNHLEQVNTQKERNPMSLPTLILNPNIKNIDDFTYEDITLQGYVSHPAIKGEVAV